MISLWPLHYSLVYCESPHYKWHVAGSLDCAMNAHKRIAMGQSLVNGRHVTCAWLYIDSDLTASTTFSKPAVCTPVTAP